MNALLGTTRINRIPSHSHRWKLSKPEDCQIENPDGQIENQLISPTVSNQVSVSVARQTDTLILCTVLDGEKNLVIH